MHRTQLERSRLSRPYRQRLYSALRYFCTYLASLDCILEVVCGTPAGAERHLTKFVQFCYDNGMNIWIPRHAILAVQHLWRGLKGSLKRAWDSIQSWQMTLSARNRIPFPLEVIDALFVWAILAATDFPHFAPLLYSFSVCLRLGFHGLLRPGELWRLTCGDIRLPWSGGHGAPLTGALRDTKNRRFLGRSQFFMISEAALVRWMEWFMLGRSQLDLLWPYSARAFRDLLRLGLECLELGGVGYSPGSLRSGGTTHLFSLGLEIGRIKFLGRWLSERAVGSYVQECMARFVWASLEPEIVRSISTLNRAGEFILAGPPPLAWRAVCSQCKLATSAPVGRRRISTRRMLSDLRLALL